MSQKLLKKRQLRAIRESKVVVYKGLDENLCNKGLNRKQIRVRLSKVSRSKPYRAYKNNFANIERGHKLILALIDRAIHI